MRIEGSSLCWVPSQIVEEGEEREGDGREGDTYPRGQLKLSPGLTAGTSEREMKLPST